MAHQNALRFSHFQQVRKTNPHEYLYAQDTGSNGPCLQGARILFFDLGGHHH